MDLIGAIGKWALVVFAIANVAVLVYTNRDKGGFILTIWKRVRPLMVLEVVALVAAIIEIAITLSYYVPFLGWGWTNLFFKGGGNILLSPVMEYSGSGSIWATRLIQAFLLSLLVATPFLCKAEEEIFRKGHHEWRDITKKSIYFGLAHLTVGVPLAAAIALIGAGFFFGWKYRRAFVKLRKEGICWDDAEEEAMLVSTTYHSVYNSAVCTILIVLVSLL
jgi:hypothetical protein